MMRSIWKGHIRFSLVTIPIRIYNAVDTEETIRFNQLHKEDNGPVGYDKKCKKCGKVLGTDEIVKGYQFEPEQYVIISPEDIEKIRLKSTRVIEIEGFIDASEVHPTLYESPYFAGPDGPVAAKTYSLLTQALQASGKVGIGKVVLREREEVVLIAPLESGLVLYKLRTPQELRKIGEVPQLEKMDVNKEELKLSISLVESMATNLEDVDMKDQYRDALREMIDAKIAETNCQRAGGRKTGGGYHERAAREHRKDQGAEEAHGESQRCEERSGRGQAGEAEKAGCLTPELLRI